MTNDDLKALRFVHKHKTKKLPKHMAKQLWRKLMAMAERDPQIIQWAHTARNNYLLALRLASHDDRATASFESRFGKDGHGYDFNQTMGSDDGQGLSDESPDELPEQGAAGGDDLRAAGT